MRIRRPSRSSSCTRRGSPHEALIGAAVLAALAISAPAQTLLQFDELPRRGLPVQNDYTEAVALGDVDGDGDLDMVVGNGGQNRLLLNDGTGAFTDVTGTHMPPDNDSTHAVALGDVDGDGDLDLVLGNYVYCTPYCTGRQNRLYLNDGAGLFTDATATQMPVDADKTTAVALGDIDGDGDLDIVFGNVGYDRLYLNNSAGSFADVTATQMPAGGATTRAVVLGDVDGDGDLDMVLGTGITYIPPQCKYCGPIFLANASRLYLNNGTGTFVTAPGTFNADNSMAVALGDVDGDGDLDLVVANDTFPFPTTPAISPQDKLYRNDGAGSFTNVTATQMPVHAVAARSVRLCDTDGDGDLDIVFGGNAGLFLNDGSGTFTDATSQRLPATGGDVAALGDLDADGDLDLVYGNNGQNSLFLNLQRQLHAPVDLVIHTTYELDAYMRYGPVGQGTFALPVVSFGPASTPVPPYGTLGLAQPLIALPLIQIPQSPPIPQPPGVGSLSLPIPNLPAYVGIRLYSQALLVPYPLQPTLSNVVSDVLQ